MRIFHLSNSPIIFRLGIPLGILGLWTGLAILGPLLPLSPNAITLPNILLPGNPEEWLGFDDLGRPIADRLIVGAQTSCFVAFTVVAISLSIGSLLGTISGYVGGWTDFAFVRIIDVFLAFPGILLAIALAGVMGPGIDNVVIALSVVGWVGYARLARAQVLSIKERDHVSAAVAIGTGPAGIMMRHLLPLISAPLIVEASFGIAGVVIGEAGLSFLGLGVQAPAASWGSMIRDGTRYMLVAPHMVIAPGLALMLVVLAVNLLGDWLRDWLDVKLQTRKE
ncbi:ABC transporter permease [Candidatus Nitronereus thalassa]|uniref:ABC transporter permease n=1 Tax=Candidatus Nitronereus thalassa TaxID=3020898 RepID=A0ABU3K9V3_9BACT|nr:ABC transporter permease [Candidatus Nitronereus thalassa]MDT7043170.1 ABC transporter permease [Candidatus Nitronereus thalassa]